MTNTAVVASDRDSGIVATGLNHIRNAVGWEHAVRFYDDSDLLASAVVDFLSQGFVRGEPAIVIATREHCEAIRRRLQTNAVDSAGEISDSILWLDAEETLLEFMDGAAPNPSRFHAIIGAAIDRATRGNPGLRFRAYGEMVDLLCGLGNAQGALRLEELWNELSRAYSFSLLCGYRMDRFHDADDAEKFERVCNTHFRVCGANAELDAIGAEATRRELARLQQRARALETELIHRKRLELELRAATQLKDEFLANVSHELRTPLNAILGWARMLRTGGLGPDKSERALEAIERNSLSQVRLINDLLDISRIVSGKLRLDAQPLTLSTVVEGAIDSLQPAFHAKNIDLHCSVDPAAGPINGDAHRLEQVIWNLLSNAVKFTPKGGSVRLVVERLDSAVQLTVSDTGQGISASLLPSIFERFRQADGSTARVHGGLGLGLAIVRHIVELHDGSIEAHSEGEGRGATFVARFPIAPVDSRARGPFQHQAVRAATPRFERLQELQGLTVLVVDDEDDTRDILCEVLEQCGCSVLRAANAEEGLAALDRASPRVLVCDIAMPGVDGYAFIESVRRRPVDKGGRVVAVALTAHASAEDRRRALRAGFQMHLGKPVEPAEFVAVVANVSKLAIASS